LGDAAKLTWANVDLDRKTIRFTPQKTQKRGRAIEVPLAPELEEFLLKWPGTNERPNAPLLPTLSPLRTGGCNGLSARFRKLMAESGVEGHEHEPRLQGKGRKFHELTFHSLRHTCVSAMANNGVAREVRMKIAGHTSDAHERYTHLELDLMRQALSALPRLLE
jgi:integrase